MSGEPNRKGGESSLWYSIKRPHEHQHVQFAPELVYFSDCVREDREPEPSGIEGLADLRVLEAIQESVRTGGAVRLAPFDKPERPDEAQEIVRPAVTPPPLVATEAPHE